MVAMVLLWDLDFLPSRLSLINRNIIWVTAHIRGGMERGMNGGKKEKCLTKKILSKTIFQVQNF